MGWGGLSECASGPWVFACGFYVRSRSDTTTKRQETFGAEERKRNGMIHKHWRVQVALGLRDVPTGVMYEALIRLWHIKPERRLRNRWDSRVSLHTKPSRSSRRCNFVPEKKCRQKSKSLFLFSLPSSTSSPEGKRKSSSARLCGWIGKKAMRKSEAKCIRIVLFTFFLLSFLVPFRAEHQHDDESTTLKLKMKSDDADFPFIFNAKFSLSVRGEAENVCGGIFHTSSKPAYEHSQSWRLTMRMQHETWIGKRQLKGKLQHKLKFDAESFPSLRIRSCVVKRPRESRSESWQWKCASIRKRTKRKFWWMKPEKSFPLPIKV